VLRSEHLEQDEAIRQDNRQKAQQQKATTGLSGQVSGPNGQASPIVAELQRESDEADRQDNLQKAQEQKAQDEASREESLQRAQAVVSPFTRATVHRQIGVLQVHGCNYSSANHAVQASSNNSKQILPLDSLSSRQGTEL